MDLPSKGFVHGGSDMIDPHKLGQVMWSRNEHGTMGPHDLGGTLSARDARNLNRIFEALMAFRKVRPALLEIKVSTWDNLPAIKPYLIASTEGRAEAREMKAADDWDAFWSVVN